MDDTVLMGELNRACQSLDEAGADVGSLGRGCQGLVQAAAFDVFEGDERPAVALADLVDLDDVRMLELGDGFGLATEAAALLGAGVGAGCYHLEGDQAIQADLPGLVDHAHAAA